MNSHILHRIQAEKFFHFDLPDWDVKLCDRCRDMTRHYREYDEYVCSVCGKTKPIPPYKRNVIYNPQAMSLHKPF